MHNYNFDFGHYNVDDDDDDDDNGGNDIIMPMMT